MASEDDTSSPASGGRRDHLERAVLQVLWGSPSPVAATDVVAALPDRGLAVTTVLTVLERLRRKGLVERERVGRSYVHRAARSQEDLAAEAMLAVLAEDAGGGAHRSLALARFAASISPEDAAALREELERSARHEHATPLSAGAAEPESSPAAGGCGGASGTCGCCTCGPDCDCCAPTTATSAAPMTQAAAAAAACGPASGAVAHR